MPWCHPPPPPPPSIFVKIFSLIFQISKILSFMSWCHPLPCHIHQLFVLKIFLEIFQIFKNSCFVPWCHPLMPPPPSTSLSIFFNFSKNILIFLFIKPPSPYHRTPTPPHHPTQDIHVICLKKEEVVIRKYFRY